jgi:AAA domain
MGDTSGSLTVKASAFGTPDPEPPEDDPYDDGADPGRVTDLEERRQTHNPLGKVLKRSELSSLPDVQSLVDGVISRPAAVVLVGAYGVGKTFLVISLGASSATGRSWLGRDVHRTRVLHVLGEGAYGLDHRLTAWEAANNSGEPISDDDLTFIVQPGSLAHQPTWDAITVMAVDGGYGFVILDTFSSLAPEADETKDAALIMRRLSNLATSIEGTALLVHHPGWSDATRTRGGYQLEANADEVLVATPLSEGSDIFTLFRKKVKDGKDGATLYLRRAELIGSCYIDEVDPATAGIPLRLRILTVLSDLGETGATGKQLMDEIGVDAKGRSAFYRALNQLVDDGDVVPRGPRGRTRYWRTEYAPPEAP